MQGGFLGLFSLSGAQLSNALTQISGETATGSQQTTFNAMSQFMGLMTDPFMDRGGVVGLPMSSGYAAEILRGEFRSDKCICDVQQAPPTSSSAGACGRPVMAARNRHPAMPWSARTTPPAHFGTAVGADYLFSPNTIAGFAMAGGGTSFSVANGGTGRSDLFQVGAYVRHTAGPAYITAALAYGWQDITTNRTVTAAGIDQLRAEFNANAWSGRFEGGYRLVAPLSVGIGITPYAAAQFVTFDLPAYAEQAVSGSNNFALYYAQDVTDARTELGVRGDKSWSLDDGLRRCAGVLPGPTTTIRIVQSVRPSRRCLAQASSSTARRRRPSRR